MDPALPASQLASTYLHGPAHLQQYGAAGDLSIPGTLRPGPSPQQYMQHLATMQATHQRLEDLQVLQMHLNQSHSRVHPQMPLLQHPQQPPSLLQFEMTQGLLMQIAPDAMQHQLTAGQPSFNQAVLQQQQHQQLMLPTHIEHMQHQMPHLMQIVNSNGHHFPHTPPGIPPPHQHHHQQQLLLQQQQQQLQQQLQLLQQLHPVPHVIDADMLGSGEGEDEDLDQHAGAADGGRAAGAVGKRGASLRPGGPRKDRLALNFKGIPLLNAGYAHSWNLTRGSQVKVQLELDNVILPEVHDRELRPASKTSVRSFQTQRISRHHSSGLFHRGWRRLEDGNLVLVLSSTDNSRLPQPPKPCDSLSTKPVAAHRRCVYGSEFQK